MAFVIKLLFLTALVYGSNAGNIPHHGDSFIDSALSAPSANFGPPSTLYGAPAPSHTIAEVGAPSSIHLEENIVEEHAPLDHHSIEAHQGLEAHHGNLALNEHIEHELHSSIHDHHDGGIIGSSFGDSGFGGASLESSAAIASGPGALIGSGPGLISGPASGHGGAIFAGAGAIGGDAHLAGAGGAGIINADIGAPRVIGTKVTVGRAHAANSRYELQSVIQNVVRRVPVEVTRHVKVAVPHPVPVPVPHEVKVPVPQPYPVHVDVVKHEPYPVYKTHHVEVERPVPVEVVRQVPFEVIRKVHIPVERPYEVIRKVTVPVDKHVEVPVPVWKPYPLHIIKHITHYKKKSCCW